MKKVAVPFTLAVALFSLCLPATAQSSNAFQSPVADVTSSRVAFMPPVEGASYALTVSGPKGFFLEQKFVDAAPVFELLDSQGQLRPDGIYTFQMIVEPRVPASLRGQMAAARERGDDAALAAQLPEPVTVSGHFSIAGGAFVNPNLIEEEPALAEAGGSPQLAERVVLTTSDGVVQGSLCVGVDCPSSPSFGFTTLLMMENNLRFKFDDTSNSSSFPNQDWELQANETSNGGNNWFTVRNCGVSSQGGCGGNRVFTAEAGARNNALYVEADGDIGIGTNNPAVDLQIQTGNTPTMRLHQDGSSGFATQVWDVAGNEANFFIRDVTNGSRLVFRALPGAVADNLVLDGDGEVGIRTSSPDDILDVAVTGGNGGITVRSSTNFPQLTLDNDAIANDDGRFRYRVNGQGDFIIIHADTDSTTPFTVKAETDTNLLVLDGSEVQVTGSITVNGMTMTVPDYVFEPDYALLPIADQGEFMLTNKHLPAVGKATYGEDGAAKISLVEQQLGMLEELEKAHLYIYQLHGTVQSLETRNQHLASRLAELEGVGGEVEELKALVRQLLDSRR